MSDCVNLKLASVQGQGNQNIKNSFVIIGDSNLVYFLEGSFVLKNISTGEQTHFFKEGHLEKIHQIETYTNGSKCYLLILEQVKDNMVISIVSLHSQKWRSIKTPIQGETKTMQMD